MARDDLILQIKAAAMAVELAQVRSQRLGLRPIATFRRHRAWIVPLFGLTAGCVAGSVASRTSLSALLSTGFLAIRIQPVVARLLKHVF